MQVIVTKTVLFVQYKGHSIVFVVHLYAVHIDSVNGYVFTCLVANTTHTHVGKQWRGSVYLACKFVFNAQ